MIKKLTAALGGILLLAAALVLVGAPAAQATEQATTEVYWALPDGGTPDAVTWPQSHAPGAVECGTWYQVDLYPADAVAELTADGMLTNGEDHGVVISWRFEYGGDCPVIPTKPEPERTADYTEAIDCEAKTYTQVTTVTTVDWVYVESSNEYVKGEPVVTATSSHRPATEVECPAAVVPPVEPPASAPEVPVLDDAEPVVDTLPETGADWGLLPVGGMVLAGGLALMALARHRARTERI